MSIIRKKFRQIRLRSRSRLAMAGPNLGVNEATIARNISDLVLVLLFELLDSTRILLKRTLMRINEIANVNALNQSG